MDRDRGACRGMQRSLRRLRGAGLLLGLGLLAGPLAASARARDCDEVADVLARYPNATPWEHPRQDWALEWGWTWSDILDEARSIGPGHAGTLRSERHVRRMGQAARARGGALRFRFSMLEDGSVRYMSDVLTEHVNETYGVQLLHESIPVERKILTQGWLEVTPEGVISLIDDDAIRTAKQSAPRFPAGPTRYPTLYEVLTAQGIPLELTETQFAIRASLQ